MMKKPATKASTSKNSPATKPAVTAKAAKTKKPVITDENNWDLRLGFLMHDVSRLRRVVFDDVMKPLGVTRSQWWVLAYLSRQDGMIQSDLAGVLELGKAALGGLIDRLEVSEFIVRRSDATDRRAKRIFLTARGTQIVKDMRQLSHDMSERVLEGLTQEDRHTLFDMLTLVKKNLLAIKREEGIEE